METDGGEGKLAGKVAVVTASSRGIGAAVAERLAAEGAAVVVNYSRNADRAGEVVEGIERTGGRAVAVGADVTASEGVEKLFDEAEGSFGRVDVLVNKAGGWNFNEIADVSEEELDRYFALNAKSAFFGMQEAARRMRDGGRVINVSTAATVVAPAEQSVYVGAKAAAEASGGSRPRSSEGAASRSTTCWPARPTPSNSQGRRPRRLRSRWPRLRRSVASARPKTSPTSWPSWRAKRRWVTGANISASGGLA